MNIRIDYCALLISCMIRLLNWFICLVVIYLKLVVYSRVFNILGSDALDIISRQMRLEGYPVVYNLCQAVRSRRYLYA